MTYGVQIGILTFTALILPARAVTQPESYQTFRHRLNFKDDSDISTISLIILQR